MLFCLGGETHDKRSSEYHPYQCELCHKTLSSMRCLREHRAMHNPVDSFNCEFCCQTFITERRVQEHVRRAHGIKRHHCTYCKKAFFARSDMKKHLQVHIDAPAYSCNFCEMSFRSQFSLELHRRTHDGKNFSCPFCWKVYLVKQALQHHIKLKHAGTIVIIYHFIHLEISNCVAKCDR